MAAVRAILDTIHGLARSGGRLLGEAAAGTAALPDRIEPPATSGLDWEGPYSRAGVEPELDELLSDTVVQLAMHADHLEAADFRRLSNAGDGR